MIDLQDFQILLSESLLGGDTALAGMAIYIAVMAAVFVLLNRKTFAAFALMIPITFVFTTMGILSDMLTVLLIIVALLGLGLTSRTLAGRMRWASASAAGAAARPNSTSNRS